MSTKVFLLLALTPFFVTAARADDAALARARYAAVDKAVPRATVIKRELQGYSLEGGQLTAYFQKGVPLKLVAKHYGESGRTTDEMVFWQGRLFFMLRTSWHYDRPLGAGANSSEPPKLIQDEQARYYFKNGKLWRWIGFDGKVIESGAEFRNQEENQLALARELLAGARGKAKVIEAP